MPRKSAVIYHRCPACAVVLAAAEFVMTHPRGRNSSSEQRVRCPRCGHDAPPLAFPKVEPPAEAEQPEGRD